MEPPTSVAVALMVMVAGAASLAPSSGAVRVTVGGVFGVAVTDCQSGKLSAARLKLRFAGPVPSAFIT
jgi:hypothetical protein